MGRSLLGLRFTGCDAEGGSPHPSERIAEVRPLRIAFAKAPAEASLATSGRPREEEQGAPQSSSVASVQAVELITYIVTHSTSLHLLEAGSAVATGVAAGTLNTFRTTGLSFGIALMGAIVGAFGPFTRGRS